MLHDSKCHVRCLRTSASIIGVRIAYPIIQLRTLAEYKVPY